MSASFDLTGRTAQLADTIAYAILASLLRNRWLADGAPTRARYQLHGRVRDEVGQRLRAMVVLSDRATGRASLGRPLGWRIGR